MILRLVWETVRVYSNMVLSFIMDPIFWVMFFILLFQYKRLEEIQMDIYGAIKYKKIDMLSSSILAGILAGMVVSIVVVVFGITFFKLDGVGFLILLSLLLAFFVDNHFVCLSYSGGIISLISLILGYINNKGIINISAIPILNSLLDFDVSAILILVALLHFVEAILMYFDGARYPIPMFFKRDGEVIGGFLMSRFWTIPLIILLFVSTIQGTGEYIPTPDWWPLIKPSIKGIDFKNAVFVFTPLFAILGYGDFTVSEKPKNKVKKSSMYLFLFSITLFVLSILSLNIYVFKYISSIFSPIAHELIIILSRKKEVKSIAKWGYISDGINVLDVIPNSPAEKMGIQSGDKIVAINNKRVNNLYEAKVVIDESDRYLWIDIEKEDGSIKHLEYYDYRNDIDSIGIISIPIGQDVPLMDLEKR